MSHHSDRELSPEFGKQAEERDRIVREAFKDAHLRSALGPTGEFPEGKLVSHDEGALTFAVGHQKGKVTIEFGSPVKWFGMTPSQARQLADLLIARADQAQIIQPNADDLKKQIHKILQKPL